VVAALFSQGSQKPLAPIHVVTNSGRAGACVSNETASDVELYSNGTSQHQQCGLTQADQLTSRLTVEDVVNPCDELRLWLVITGFGAFASAAMIATGNLPVGAVSAIGTLVGLWKVAKLQRECQALQSRS